MENVFEDRLKQEINKLIEIGLKNGKLSRMTVIHLLMGKNQVDDYTKVMSYMASKGVEFIDEDIELEEKENKGFVHNQFLPFDSTKINIASKPLSVEGLVMRLNHNEIDMNTEFQRKGGLWDEVTKSQLIESLMLRIPLPVFYFDGTKDDKWLVIDGLQRLTTFKEFFIEKTLKLSGLEYFGDYNGCSYDDLPRTYIRRMEETQLFLYIIQPGTPSNVKFNIFKRINTPGLKLESQEIRHALYQGKSTRVLKRIAESDKFKQVTGNSISNERMVASEIVLRFLAFKILGPEVYNKMSGQLELFLNEAMDRINLMKDEEIKKYEKNFYSTLDTAYEIFGIYAFRRMTAIENGRKNQFNVALYETWMLNLSILTNEERLFLVSNRKKLIEKFVEKLQDKAFGYDISSGKRIAVLRRIETVKGIINGVLIND